MRNDLENGIPLANCKHMHRSQQQQNIYEALGSFGVNRYDNKVIVCNSLRGCNTHCKSIARVLNCTASQFDSLFLNVGKKLKKFREKKV